MTWREQVEELVPRLRAYPGSQRTADLIQTLASHLEELDSAARGVLTLYRCAYATAYVSIENEPPDNPSPFSALEDTLRIIDGVTDGPPIPEGFEQVGWWGKGAPLSAAYHPDGPCGANCVPLYIQRGN